MGFLGDDDAVFNKGGIVPPVQREIEVIVRGPAGSGKTTFIHALEDLFSKNFVTSDCSPIRDYSSLHPQTAAEIFASRRFPAKGLAGMRIKFFEEDAIPAPAPRGYHLSAIPQGTYGEFSKIEEELYEAKDAAEQGVKIMELVELSDMLLAVEGYLKKHHPGTTLDDLRSMAAVTNRAFETGHRVPKR